MSDVVSEFELSQKWYDEAIKQWVVEEECLDTDDFDKWSHAFAVFDELAVEAMDKYIKDVATAGYEDSGNSLYTWRTILIPVNPDISHVMSADYNPKQRYYDPKGDFLPDPAKYFAELHTQGLKRRLAIEALFQSIPKSDVPSIVIRADLGLKRLV